MTIKKVRNPPKGDNWKVIKEYPNYMVSNKGEIYSLYFDKVMREKDNGHGYKAIILRNGKKYKNFYIHRLVALHFLEIEKGKNIVNHKDGDKSNNNVENLEWCTQSYNNKHKYRVLKRPVSRAYLGKFGKEHNRSKKIAQYDLEGNFIQYHYGVREAARKMKTVSGNIHNCLSGFNHTAKGFIWRYA